jgi:signal transduction histidine kinase
MSIRRTSRPAPERSAVTATRLQTLIEEAETCRYLAQVSRAFARSLEPEEILRTLAGLAVPRTAEACLVEILEPSGQARLCAVTHENPGRAPLLEQLRQRHPPFFEDPNGLGLVLRSRQMELFREIPATVLHPSIARRLGVRAAIVAPLGGRDRVSALVTLLSVDASRWQAEEQRALVDDLVQRAALASENAHLLAEARRAVEMREDVLAMVSHDLASPIGAVLLSAEALRRSLPESARAAAERALSTLTRAAQQAQRLVTELGSLAAVQTGTISLRPEVHEAAALVDAALSASAAVLGERLINVKTRIAVGAPVLCDRERTLEALSALIGSAARSSAPGGTVELSAEPLGRMMKFAITDSGPGIPRDELARLFGGEGSRRDKRAGRRIGLVLSKRLIEAHRGRMWVDSRLGQGTTVSFVLPAPVPAWSRAAEPAARVQVLPPAPEARAWNGPFRRRARGAPSP